MVLNTPSKHAQDDFLGVETETMRANLAASRRSRKEAESFALHQKNRAISQRLQSTPSAYAKHSGAATGIYAAFNDVEYRAETDRRVVQETLSAPLSLMEGRGSSRGV